MAAKDPTKPFRLCAEVRTGILAAHAESLLPTCRQGFFGMIDSTGLDTGVGQKLEKYSAPTADVQHRTGISKKLDKRLLNPAKRIFAATKLV
jgi:hypothetical protein